MTDDRNLDEHDGHDHEAAVWCMRMHGDDAASWRERFEEWLRADPHNLEAYNQIEEVYIISGAAPRRKEDPVNAGQPARATAERRRWKAGLLLAGLAAVAGTLVLCVDRPLHSISSQGTRIATDLRTPTVRSFRTDGAGLERIVLDDGSVVTLYAASELSTKFDARMRLLTLSRGGARFEVAHEPRPFVVSAGGGRITAKGTIFEVRLRDDHAVSVDLLRGAIDVALPSNDKNQDAHVVRHLQPGQNMVFTQEAGTQSGGGNVGQSISPAGADTAPPQTVAELVARTSAAYPKGPKLVVDDDRILKSAIGGAFRLRDPDTMAEWLSGMFEMTIDRSAPGRIVLRAPPAPAR